MGANPVAGEQWTYHVVLNSYAAPGEFQIDPTLATGDVVYYRNGARIGALATLPIVVQAGEPVLLVTVTAAETTGASHFGVKFADVAGAEWGARFDEFACAPAPALESSAQSILTEIVALNDLSAAQVNAEVDTALADVGLTTTITGRIDAAVSSRSTYAGADTAGTTTLLARVVGTLAAGTHVAQSGDSYPTVGTTSTAVTALQGDVTTVLSLLPEGLRAATAYAALPFHLVLSADHLTPATGLVPTCEIKWDTGNYIALASPPVEKGAGDYYVPLTTADIPTGATWVTCRFAATGADTLIFSLKVTG